MSYTSKELSQRLAQSAERLAQELFPNGKRNGRYWEIGSVSGEAGQSLKICISGSGEGNWKDYAAGQGTLGVDRGDMLDLIAAHKGIPLSEAMRDAAAWLKLPEVNRTSVTVSRTYGKPSRKGVRALVSGSAVYNYIANERGIAPEAARRANVCEMEFGEFGTGAVFPIYDTDGKTVDVVKFEALERPNGKKVCRTTAPSPKWHLIGWNAMGPNERSVVICEGEWDWLTLLQFGIPSLSLPNGASGHDWIDNDYDHLLQFSDIVLAFDDDDAGNAAAETVANRLGKERCRRAKFDGHKDANAALVQGKWTADQFRNAVEAAKDIGVRAIVNVKECEDEIMEALFPSETAKGTEFPFSPEWRIRPGEVTVWTGWNGSGKSHVLSQVSLHDFAANEQRSLIVSLEMPVGKTFAKMARMCIPTELYKEAAPRVIKWLSEGMWAYRKVGIVKWEKLFPEIEYAVRRYGITRVVIDSLMRLGVSDNDNDAQKACVEAAIDLAAKLGVHIHLVAHARKPFDSKEEERPPRKTDIKGSGSITDLVHNVWAFWRNLKREDILRDLEDMEPSDSEMKKIEEAGATLFCWKNREDGVHPKISVWIHGDVTCRGNGQFLLGRNAEPRTYFKL